MSVYITLAGEILAVPTEDDLAPQSLCDDDCRACAVAGTSLCAVRMRRFELIADAWMIQDLA